MTNWLDNFAQKKMSLFVIFSICLVMTVVSIYFWPGSYSTQAIRYLNQFDAGATSCWGDWKAPGYACLLDVFSSQKYFLAFFFLLQLALIAISLIYTFNIFKRNFGAAVALSSVFFIFLFPENIRMFTYIERSVFYSWLLVLSSLLIFDSAMSKSPPGLKKKAFYLILMVLYLLAATVRKEGILMVLVGVVQILILEKVKFKKIIWAVGIFIFVTLVFIPQYFLYSIPKVALADQYSLNASMNTFYLLYNKHPDIFSDQDRLVIHRVVELEKIPRQFLKREDYNIVWSNLMNATPEQVRDFNRLVYERCIEHLVSCIKVKNELFLIHVMNFGLYSTVYSVDDITEEGAKKIRIEYMKYRESSLKKVSKQSFLYFVDIYKKIDFSPYRLSIFGSLFLFLTMLILPIRKKLLTSALPIYVQVLVVFLLGTLGKYKYFYALHLHFMIFFPLLFFLSSRLLYEKFLLPLKRSRAP